MDKQHRARVERALRHWVDTRNAQGEAALASGRSQGGSRDKVTGGKHLDAFGNLIAEDVQIACGGLRSLQLHYNTAAKVAGYYRSSKSWDLLVTENAKPLLAVEFKSMVGSEGKNLNNRADEAFGIAEDAKQAEAHGILPPNMLRAYIFIMGESYESTRPVSGGSPFGWLDPVFESASYMERAAIMCRRVRETGLYQLTWMLAVAEYPFSWHEPDEDIGYERFLADLRAGLA